MKSSSPTTVVSDQKEEELTSDKQQQQQSQQQTSDDDDDDSSSSVTAPMMMIVRENVRQEITKQVLRKKLSKLRHLVIPQGINPAYLESLFPKLLEHFDPQTVHYNGGVAKVREWKISCYLEVMEGGIPCTNPNLQLLDLFQPLLNECDGLFLEWYRQQHACNNAATATVLAEAQRRQGKVERTCKRLMTFVTRYTPAPGEQALLKHVDGAGKVDGSVVVALPIDRWSASEEENSFIGHGGGLTFWDGKNAETKRPDEIHYETRAGDLAFIDRAVWHQADPISKGTRWALVIFYDVQTQLVQQDEDER